jgi:hypothetical protein
MFEAKYFKKGDIIIEEDTTREVAYLSPPILLARIRTHLRLKRVTDYLKGKLEAADLC